MTTKRPTVLAKSAEEFFFDMCQSVCDFSESILHQDKKAMTQIIEQAMTQARNEALEEAAKESDYFANNSTTGKNISKNIRALKGEP